jgi:replicative DNA helicase
MDFDLEFETDILSNCLVDKKYLKEAFSVLSAHHFGTDELSWCWDVISDVWRKNKELARGKVFVYRAKKLRDENRLEYLKVVSKLFKNKPKAPKTAFDELKKFVLTVEAQKTLENALDKIEKNDIEGAYKEFSLAGRKKENVETYKSSKWIEEFEERQTQRKKEKENPELVTRIPTGINKIDKILNGGIQKGELGLVMATTSQGKSSLLTNFAYIAVANKYKVVYFTFEMSIKQIAMRQDARWLKIDYDKFKTYNFTKEEKNYIKRRLKKARKKYLNSLRIAYYPMGKPSIESLYKVLDDYYEEDKFVPDLVIIDSPDHMRSVKNQKEIRIEQKLVYQDCKALADDYAVWVSTHAGREWKKKIATSEAAGESYDKSRIADIVLTLNTPDKNSRTTKLPFDDEFDDDEESILEPGHRFIEFYLAKYRDGEARISIPIDSNFKQYVFTEIL